jgi:hypothetical protein
MRRRSGLILLSVAALVALSAGCRPRASGRCTFGQAACIDSSSGLFCGADGTYRTVPCHGRDGCVQEGARVSCDQSSAAVGDACTKAGFACAAEMKSLLSCQNGQFALAQTCRGPFACRVAPYDGFAPGGAGNVLCDNDVASAGDPCLDEGDVACTADRTEALKCTGKKMVAFHTCDGPRHCSIVHPTSKDTGLECDMSQDGG